MAPSWVRLVCGVSQELDKLDGLDASKQGKAQERETELAAPDALSPVWIRPVPRFEGKSAVHLVPVHLPLGEHSGEFIAFKQDAIGVLFQDVLKGLDCRVVDTKPAQGGRLQVSFFKRSQVAFQGIFLFGVFGLALALKPSFAETYRWLSAVL